MAKRWCFTLNNYTANETDDISTKLVEICKYLIAGREVGESGTPHIQGFCVLKKPSRMSAIKRIIPRAHIEKCRGSVEQNVEYCKKGGSFDEWGTIRTNQGQRNDLDAVKDLARRRGMRLVVTQCNYQQIRVAEKYLTWCEDERNAHWSEMDVQWAWGPTGSGKTEWVREQTKDLDAFWMVPGKWWDGYDNHAVVVLDDFRGSWWKLSYMLRLLQPSPFRVEIKGAHRQMRAVRFLITSVMHPREVYSMQVDDPEKDPIEQLLRRINNIIHFGSLGAAPPPPVIEPPETRVDVEEVGGNTRPRLLQRAGALVGADLLRGLRDQIDDDI